MRCRMERRQRRSFTDDYKRQAIILWLRMVVRSGRWPKNAGCAILVSPLGGTPFRADRRLFDRRDGLFRIRHAKLAGDAEPVARDTGAAVDLHHAIPAGLLAR